MAFSVRTIITGSVRTLSKMTLVVMTLNITVNTQHYYILLKDTKYY
jgi:hypothetical protein